jgi:hypothetical protein
MAGCFSKIWAARVPAKPPPTMTTFFLENYNENARQKLTFFKRYLVFHQNE